MLENKYLIKFCDRETGQLLIPFGHIDNLVMPSVKQDYFNHHSSPYKVHSLGSKNQMYLPGKYEITPYPVMHSQPFSATYVDLENNEGGYFFWRYLELKPTRLCGSIFASKEMKMLAYFDDAFVQSTELKYGLDDKSALDFSLQVNGWEWLEMG